MRASVSWMAEFVDLPPGLEPRALGDALVRVGLEVERVESAADGISGPVVVGRVLSFVDEPQKNGKVIRWCSVDVGEAEPRGIVCGAHNFAAGDLIIAVLPGATLPGGFDISARKTYGHVSDGMICSARELGVGSDHDGIVVLEPGSAEPGDDGLDRLGLRDAVLDIAVTPDRGYCLSVRGLAREAGAALDVQFHDLDVALPARDQAAYPITVSDSVGCDQFSARAVTGFDPGAPTPPHIAARLRSSGMRSISLAVDITNYVMLETGQPLHAFDRSKLSGGIGVRRAEAGEKLTTLDGIVRALDPDDLVVTDDSGPVALAGVMGGASTEITAETTAILLEAAHWNPAAISRAVRRHKLPSEAAKRFERGVDPRIAGVALQRCVDLLVRYGSAVASPGYSVIGDGPAPITIVLPVLRAAELSGLTIAPQTVRARLEQVGCLVAPDQTSSDRFLVTPPTWRPDLTDPADLVEEVVRLVGYDKVPSILPTAPAGNGWTPRQKLRRSVSRALAGAGYTEVINYPFVSPSIHDLFGLAVDDERRHAIRLANPISEAEPEMRTSLLPGLLANLLRNIGRGSRDLATFEMGLIYLPAETTQRAPRPSVEHRPSDAELAAIARTVPRQPRHVATLSAGDFDRSGWWGAGRAATWADAIESARTIARMARAELRIRQAHVAPWHPGRCAELLLGDKVIGVAGELDPKVVAALDLPPRVNAMELDLDAFDPPPPAQAPEVSNFPPVLLDVALVVPEAVPASEVMAAVRTGAGELLESVRLFDVYSDETRLGPGVRSLAFALRFRAPDRTLTLEEATAARDAAVAEAGARFGATLRG
ncbi:phenylalanine--tRNA ligase subunit beta [Jatrophihabitans sp. DSM 45814]